MLKPRALRPGDRLAIVSPASPFNRDEFDRGIAEIKALGFEPVYEESVFERQSYVSGSPQTRAKAIRDAWNDPSIAGLIAARGGYGSAQVLPLLDREEARRACKPFVGYSDITSLLTFVTLGCGVVSFHGPMLDRRLSRGAEGYDRESFLRCLSSTDPIGELTSESVEAIHHGESTGMLFGGTLTQLLASLGTPFAFAPPQGYVLFLDEVGERPYRLDREVTQFRQAGLLAQGVGGGDRPAAELRRAFRRASRAKRDGRPVCGISRSSADRVSIGPHDGPDDDAAFRHIVPRRCSGRPCLVIEESAVL